MRSRVKLFLRNFWRPLAWCVLILILCLQKVNRLPKSSFFAQIPHFDKIVHFGLYFCFTLFLLGAFTRQYQKSDKRAYLWSFLIALLLGILIEIIQPFTGRGREFYDFLSNLLGIIIAIIFFRSM